MTSVLSLTFAVDRQKGFEIALGYPHGTTKAVGYEFEVFDPAADGPGRDMKTLRDLGDGEKSERFMEMTTSRHLAGPARLAIVMGWAMRNLATADFLPT